MEYNEIDIDEEQGLIDNIVVMEKGQPDTALILLGWDEVGLFDSNFDTPVYARVEEQS